MSSTTGALSFLALFASSGFVGVAADRVLDEAVVDGSAVDGVSVAADASIEGDGSKGSDLGVVVSGDEELGSVGFGGGAVPDLTVKSCLGRCFALISPVPTKYSSTQHVGIDIVRRSGNRLCIS